MPCNFECEACTNSYIATEIRRYNVIEFTDDIIHGLEQAIVREIPCLRENWGNVTGESLVNIRRVADTPCNITVAYSFKHMDAVAKRRQEHFAALAENPEDGSSLC